MDYHARMYDAGINQFQQPDTMIPDLYNPQSLNRYSYVMDRPTVLTDPTGHAPSYCYQWTYVCPSNGNGDYDTPQPAGSSGKKGGSSDYFSVQKSSSSLDPMSEFWNITGLTPESFCDALLRSSSNPGCNPEAWDAALGNGPSSGFSSSAASPVYGPQYYGSPQDPDYHQIAVSGGTVFGATAAFTWDRYGDTFFGFGGYGGAKVLFSVYDTNGWIGSNTDNSYPSRSDTKSFLSNLTINASAGFLGGAGVTYSPGSNTGKLGFEEGYYSPQAQITVMYSWLLP